MIYYVTESGFLRRFGLCSCIVAAVVVTEVVVVAVVAAIVSSGENSESDDFSCQENLFSVICR